MIGAYPSRLWAMDYETWRGFVSLRPIAHQSDGAERDPSEASRGVQRVRPKGQGGDGGWGANWRTSPTLGPRHCFLVQMKMMAIFYSESTRLGKSGVIYLMGVLNGIKSDLIASPPHADFPILAAAQLQMCSIYLSLLNTLFTFYFILDLSFLCTASKIIIFILHAVHPSFVLIFGFHWSSQWSNMVSITSWRDIIQPCVSWLSDSLGWKLLWFIYFFLQSCFSFWCYESVHGVLCGLVTFQLCGMHFF